MSNNIPPYFFSDLVFFFKNEVKNKHFLLQSNGKYYLLMLITVTQILLIPLAPSPHGESSREEGARGVNNIWVTMLTWMKHN